ncbi:MAG: (Fe-S)-binding protein [Chloroflexota bacterium]
MLVVICNVAAYWTFNRMFAIINRGQGTLNWDELPQRVMNGVLSLFTQGRIIRHRKLSSIFHMMIAYAFIFYLLINLIDVIRAFSAPFGEWYANGWGVIGFVIRFVADILTVLGMIGMAYFLVRRFLADDQALQIRENVVLNPKAREGGIRKDSLIVGIFMLLHLGFRFLAETFEIAKHGSIDPAQPFASLLGTLWIRMNQAGNLSDAGIEFGIHAGFWVAIGLILLFLPYFPYTKHAHLFMGPLNFMTRPDRGALGALNALDFEDESIEQFGVNNLEQLEKTQILDAFACIMCNRCQEVCPAYATGKELSPAALEVNKRYYLKENLVELANGAETLPLLDFAISKSAVWACTSCAACVDICPVGNEPMIDILDMRRDLMLTQNEFPHELENAYRGIERAGNPWNNPEDRMGWAAELDFEVPTVEENPEFDYLFWVGCAGAFDPAAQKVARAVATILYEADANFAVLGNAETCTGDPARRSGNEYLFFEMASANVEVLNEFEVDKKKIVTSCPHCLTSLGTEYKQFGGDYTVYHHTQMIADFVGQGKLTLQNNVLEKVTFHDPCYLGRHNGIYDDPRTALAQAGATLMEMDLSGSNSFCCGAGGAQMWKEEEHGTEAVNINRYNQAKATGADTIAVGCPFCAQMMNDANDQDGSEMQVKDVAQIIVDAIKK